MKTKIVGTVAVLLASSHFLCAATNEITTLVQKGLFEEEANHNLDAAVQAYQTAIENFDKDRKLAATAIFRLGECYRKQGNTNDASAQYQRILREFPDQAALAKLCQEYVGKVPATLVSGAADDSTMRVLSTRLTALESQLPQSQARTRSLQASYETVTNFDKGNLETYFSVVRPDNSLQTLLAARSVNSNRLVAISDGYGPKSDVFKSATKDLDTVESEITARIQQLESGLKLEYEMAEAEQNVMQAQIHKTKDQMASNPSEGRMPSVAQQAPPNAAAASAAGGEIDRESEAIQRIKEMLRDTPDLVNGRPTELLQAVDQGWTNVVKLLLDHGANIEGDGNGVTPLNEAINWDRTGVIDLLLSRGANVNTGSMEGTPLHDAAYRGFRTVAESLIAHGADVNGRSDKLDSVFGAPGEAPLHAAAAQGFRTMAELLLEHGAKVDEPDRAGQTPLFRAVENGKLDMAQFLIDKGARVDAKAANGATPLFYATQHNNVEMARFLISKNADVNVLDHSGKPPLAYVPSHAIEAQIKDILLKAGANKDYERLSGIFFSQAGTGSIGSPAFFKDTNSYNQFTLLDLIELVYSGDRGDIFVPFPDFARVTINRLLGNGKTQDVSVNLDEILKSDDCSRDIPLKWGDVIQIPQLDHLISEQWSGLSREVRSALIKCLQRNVEIVVKEKTTRFTLLPAISTRYASRGALFDQRPIIPNGIAEPHVLTFTLYDLIHESNVLLLSSDLSRVKVTRRNPASPDHPQVMQFDLTTRPNPDLWLRDGDVIEIPERNPNTAANNIPANQQPEAPGLHVR